MELQSRYSDLQARGIGLAVVTYDSTDTLKRFADARGIEFPLLSDSGSATIKRYDLLNREMDPTSRFAGVPYPGTFILDMNGRVQDRAFLRAYQERLTVATIAVRLADPIDGTDRNVTRVETDHLEALVWVTDGAVAPGNRFALVADVTPKPDMHVYAPGDHDYPVIQFRMDAPEFLRNHEAIYPSPQTYYFEPLDETVPVYEEPFRLVQDVTIPMSPEIETLAAEPGATVVLKGVLAYQACDSEVCYLPAEVPLSWELTWRPLVR